MQTTKFENRDLWMEQRVGKILGSTAKDILPKANGGGKKVGFFQLIADRMALPADGEDAMERGNRLEKEAIEKFTEKTGLAVDAELYIWQRDDDSDIAISPDGVIGADQAIEVKCLNSAAHIEAVLTGKIPSAYTDQIMQYFVVNDDLKALHFVMYDPRITAHSLITFVVNRTPEYDKLVQERLKLERQTLAEVRAAVEQLSDF